MVGRSRLTPSAGEIWLADRGDERRRHVFVISDDRFQRLAERAIVAPILEVRPDPAGPWHIPLEERTIAVNLQTTLPLERLLERVGRAGSETLRQVRHAARAIVG